MKALPKTEVADVNPCRIEPSVPCTGKGGMEIEWCARAVEEDGCPGPVDMTDNGWNEKRASKPGRKTKPPERETKPAAPEAREEEKTMPSPTKPTLATCPECQRPDLILYNCKHQPGAKFCGRCSAKFAHRAKSGGTAKATKASNPAPAPAAPKASAPKVIAQQWPAAATSVTFVPLTAKRLADALLDDQVITLQVSITKVSEMLAILRAVEDDHSVMISVDSGGKQG